MEQSLEKAISIDEWTGETLTSSMVDDVFYILRLASYRALETINLQALTAILGQLNTLLVNALAQALDHRWKVIHALQGFSGADQSSTCFAIPAHQAVCVVQGQVGLRSLLSKATARHCVNKSDDALLDAAAVSRTKLDMSCLPTVESSSCL